MHNALPVGMWSQSIGHSVACMFCGMQETQSHCLWSCQAAQAVWMRVLRILRYIKFIGVLSWGQAMWSSLSRIPFSYEDSEVGVRLRIATSGVTRVFSSHVVFTASSREALQIWELLSSTTMWFIWKARCKKVFKGSKTPPAKTVSTIWVELVLTLRSQFESIIGDSDVAEQRRLHFHKTWTPAPFYFQRGSAIIWNYHPPKWIFPPPIT